MGELEALKIEETAVEDSILGLMQGQADAETQLPALTAEVGREKTEFQQKERLLRGVEEKLRAELAAAEKARVEVVAALEPEKLQVYQRILKLRGSAVAEARDEFCLGCRTKMPSQSFVEAMRNDRILNCPQCHRILFCVKPEVCPTAAPAAAPGTEPAA
jgi:predicted  nucleic acid-binding Zn-ribbon protein